MDRIIEQLVTEEEHTVMLENNEETSKYKYVIAERGEIYSSCINNKDKATQKYLESRAAIAVFDNAKIMGDVNVVLIRRYINKQAKNNCMACELNDPSQDRHTCLSTPWEETVYRFFTRGYALLTDDIVSALYGTVYLEINGKNASVDIS